MKVMLEKTLPTGEHLRILRYVTPEEIPERIIRYWIASLRFDTYRLYVSSISYWRLYFREAFAGNFASETVDHIYLAEVNGEYAARMWFAYSKKTLHGNFGHVFTEPAFRKRGLMSELLKVCIADFHASPAEMLCCASGNAGAVRAYVNSGFKLIYGGTTGPLALVKNGSFETFNASCCGKNGKPCIIREGTIGDQYDCDKNLAYCRNVYCGKRNFRRGMAVLLPDFCTVYQEVLSGNGKVFVAETPEGAIIGYAFALKFYNNGIFDFTWNSDYASEIPALLKKTLESVDFPVTLSLDPEDREKAELAKAAGMVPAVPGRDCPELFTLKKECLVHKQ